MKRPHLRRTPLFRVLGTLWLCSLFVYLFLGSVTYAGDEPALRSWICATCVVLWIVSGVLLSILFARSLRTAKAGAPAAPRAVMVRWLAAVGCGLLGGVGATLANHLFPGRWTNRADLLSESVLFALVGMLVGAIPLAFPFKPRKTALLAFLLSAAFSWWVVALNFR